MTNIEEKGYAEKVKFARYNKYSDAVKSQILLNLSPLFRWARLLLRVFYLLMQVPLLLFLALFTNNMKIFLVANQKLLDAGVTILDSLLFCSIGVVFLCLSYISQCYNQDNYEEHISEMIAPFWRLEPYQLLVCKICVL